MNKIYACQGVNDGIKCDKLFDGEKPKNCPVCGSEDIRQGIQNLTLSADLFKTIPKKGKRHG